MQLCNMIGTAILLAGIAHSEECPTVTVHYINQAALSPTILKRALGEAGWIFAKSGIKIQWVKSNGESMPADPTHILITFVGTDPRPGAPSEAAMGYAYVKEERANRAVIIFKNIQAFAARNAGACGCASW